MAQRYLLDTNILSDLIRNPSGQVTRHVAEVGEDAVCTSVIVAAELRFGARQRGSEKLSRQVEAVLDVLEILPFETPCDTRYAEIRLHLEQQGTPIGANDLLIASQALEASLVLVTHNGREFSRIPGLHMEDWLQ